MPLYEYECRSCGERLETLQRMSEAPLTTCPKCGGELKKLPSAPAVQFKGSGWYVTDYAGKTKTTGKDEGAKADEKAKPADSGGETTKSDAAAKAEKPAGSAAKGD